MLLSNLREVSKIRHMRKMIREYRTWKGVDLSEPLRLEPERFPGDRRSFDPATHRSVGKHAEFIRYQ